MLIRKEKAVKKINILLMIIIWYCFLITYRIFYRMTKSILIQRRSQKSTIKKKTTMKMIPQR